MSNWCGEKGCFCNNATEFGYCKTTACIKNETKAVDAVEVVRCKGCRWWKVNYSWNGEHKVCTKEAYEPLRKAEDFCSKGEMKENEKIN